MQQTDPTEAAVSDIVQPVWTDKANAIAPNVVTLSLKTQRQVLTATGTPRREVFGFAFGNSSLADPTYGYPAWSFSMLTTIAYFGLTIAWDGTIIQSGSGWTTWNSSALTGLVSTAHANGTRVIISINLHDFSASPTSTMCAALHPAHRATTIAQTVAQIQKMHVDGVNIDYEGTNTTCAYGATLQSEMISLVTELRAALPTSYIAVDTYSGSAGDPSGFFYIPGIAASADALFVMAYDMEYFNYRYPPLNCTSFCIGPTAPLATYHYNDTTAMAEYTAVVPSSKVILGVPYYGRKECVANVTPTTAPPNAYPVSQSIAADGYLDASTENGYSANSNYRIHREVHDTAGYERWDTWTSSQANCTREMYFDDVVSLGYKYDLINKDRLRGVGIFALQYGGGSPELWHLLTVKFSSTTVWDSLGGTLVSDPDMASGAAGRLDVFARGADKAIWHRMWDGTTWHAWESLGGTLLSGPGTVASSPNRIDLFARGADNALWHRTWDGTTWHAWESLGGTITSDPDAADSGPNRIDVFARGADLAMWHRWWDGTTWHAWESLGGTLNSAPGAVSWGSGRLDLFARGTDFAMWHRSWNGSIWGRWESLWGRFNSGPDAASCSVGQLGVFAVGGDGGLAMKTLTGSTWSPWQPQGGDWNGSGPGAACQPTTSSIDVVERTPDGAVWHSAFVFVLSLSISSSIPAESEGCSSQRGEPMCASGFPRWVGRPFWTEVGIFEQL